MTTATALRATATTHLPAPVRSTLVPNTLLAEPGPHLSAGPVVRMLRPSLPPYDDELSISHLPLAGQGVLDLTEPAPLRLAPTRLPLDQVDDDTLRRTPTDDLPAARPQAQMLAVGMIEVLAGTRPLVQLTRCTTEEVYRQLAREVRPATAATRPGVPGHRTPVRPPVVRTVHVSHPMDGVAEVVAVIQRRHRVSMIAFRLEGVHGRWRCTELMLG